MNLKRSFCLFYTLALVSLLSAACNLPSYAGPTPSSAPASAPTEAAKQTLVTFRVALPEAIKSGESVFLTVVDEVTGLAFNPQRNAMQAEDASHFIVELPFEIGSVVQYRYERQGAYSALEHSSDGRPVRYRLVYVSGPAMVQDVVSRWTDTPFQGAAGRVMGVVHDAANGEPVPNILIAAGGMQAITAADGSFLLEGLPPGTHNLVAYALDGEYRTFQQGATVAPDSATPAEINLQPAAQVDVVFTVSVPSDTPPLAEVHLAGNLTQLGDTAASLTGGISTLAVRMPVMERLPDGRYTLTLRLPAGVDLRYKYTLGDGVWNAEHKAEGGFRLRQLIVPEDNLQMEDRVDLWSTSQAAPITFNVAVPAITPQNETVSLQLNPGYGWTEPLPMWRAGTDTWTFTLFSPLGGLKKLNYRYCRDVQCGSADEAGAMGLLAAGREVSVLTEPQAINDSVESWAWFGGRPGAAVVPNLTIPPRQTGFWAGVELQSYYHPSFEPRWPQTVGDIRSLNANWIILTPTWSYVRPTPPTLELVPGSDMPWPDLQKAVLLAREGGLNVGFFPQPRYPASAETWWANAPRDFNWWVSWFINYQSFSLHFANLGTRIGATALVMGGGSVSPALPGGSLADGASSGVPEDAEQRWRELVGAVRASFKGPLLWALPYPQGLEKPPPFLDLFDGIYLLWSAPLSDAPEAAEADMQARAASLLDGKVLPFQQQTGKPVILGVAYPSARGGITSCLSAVEGQCLALEALDRPNPDYPTITLDLKEQESAYNALLLAVNERAWIGGFISRGFYPPLYLQDKSISVHGKPASGALWFWFGKFLGK